MANFKTLVPSGGLILPYLFHSGDSIIVNAAPGLWYESAGGFPNINSALGSDTLTANGFPIGRLVGRDETVNSHGVVTGEGNPYDVFSSHSASGDIIVALYENVPAGDSVESYVIADITLTRRSYDWCHTFDFTSVDGGFSSAFGGVWTNGVGWQQSNPAAGYSIIDITKVFTADIVSVVATYDASVVVTAGSPENYYYAPSDTVPNRFGIVNPSPSGTGLVLSDSSVRSVTTLGIVLYAGSSVSGDPGGTCTLRSLTICGVGANPF